MSIRDAVGKFIQQGGPVTFAGATSGVAILATTFWDGQGHKEVLAVIGVTLILLAFAEWAISRRLSTFAIGHDERFKAMQESEARQKTEILEHQKVAYTTVLSAALKPLSDEMNRMVMVFDGSAAVTEKQYREFQRMRESFEEIQKEFHKLSALNLAERVTALERAMKLHQ